MTEQEQKIDEILDRGTIVSILPDKDTFRTRLLGGEKLRFYIGFDATAPTLHLSHAKNIMLLEKFRKLGHEVIVLFGDFTARIGDPTGEKSARQQLSREDVLKNVEAWRVLIRPLMDFDATENPPQIKFNHDWLSKMSFEDVIHLSSNFTVQQMLERDMFERRIEAGEPVHLHEFLYPLMQGYDSVAMDVDVELCGTDQTFNALAGRTLLRKLKSKEKFVVTVTLMENPVTGELMSKSKGTGVFLDTIANEKFGQIMAQPDEMTKILLVNCTLLPLSDIDEIMTAENPRDAKLRLAKEIVTMYHGADEAAKAEQYFIDTFSKKQIPENISEMSVSDGEKLLDVIVRAGFAESKGDARRKIEQGGVEIDSERITDFNATLMSDHDGKVLKVGKKDFVKIIIEK
jgi:tyrosyl-tRNA synthetase